MKKATAIIYTGSPNSYELVDFKFDVGVERGIVYITHLEMQSIEGTPDDLTTDVEVAVASSLGIEETRVRLACRPRFIEVQVSKAA